MKMPLVAIVGRPNVGKSTFFNRVAGRRISIVKNEPGVTRDRIYADCEWLNYKFSLVDTGGLDFDNQTDVQKNIIRQAQIAIDLADVILFFVDGKQGLVSADYEVAEFLRKSKKPIILVVNKIDNNNVEDIYEFYQLGFDNLVPISSELCKNLGDLLDIVVKDFPKYDEKEKKEVIKIAIVGKPNAGKSSLTNCLLGEERVVVSNVAGTTRDAIDSPFRYNNQDYLLIDTAGIRKKRSVELESIESYSVLRAFEAIRRADIVFYVVDCEEGLTEQDLKIIGYVHEENKPSLIIMNKWDLIEKDSYVMDKFNKDLKEQLNFMNYFIPVYISAKTKKRVETLMPLANSIYENASKRTKTSVLNEILNDAIRMTPPPVSSGRRLKIYFISQTSTNPPEFTFSVNNKNYLHFSYERYLENCLRKNINLSGIPIKLIFKNKNKSEE